MASTTTRLMSFEEFERLPDSPWMRQELHHGELFEMPPPKLKHTEIELRLRELMEEAGRGSGKFATEIGFRPTTGPDYLIADVVFISKQHWDRIRGADYIIGAPEIVVEVLSPSNTAPKMQARRKICLENGSAEFWIVDAIKRQVEISTADHTVVYKSGEQIPLRFAPGKSIAVDAIFE
jgi:Uma2 family endonuclease